MDHGHAWAAREHPLVIWVCFLLVFAASHVHGNGVFRVQRKFGGLGGSLEGMKAHDAHRHGRVLGAVDLPLYGNGSPSDAGLYFAEIEVGTPPKRFNVQVDTGSDILWINCKGCKQCPTESDLNIELMFYDPDGSRSASSITCDQPFCTSAYEGTLLNCTTGVMCPYHVPYGDGSTTSGYYVSDLFQYEQPSENFQTKKANASIIFGCAAYQSGELSASRGAIDGIFGFGQSNSSVLSQLASSGKVKKMFTHCLDSVKGGGIFAIGNVVQPKVKSVSLIPNMPHYTIYLKGLEVGNSTLHFSSDPSKTEISGRAIIDSGTTLAYLPDEIYKQLMPMIVSSLSNMKLQIYQGFQCFTFVGSVDDQFPRVTLLFENDISLTVHPHNYLFPIQDDGWCIGWQSSNFQTRDDIDITLLGDFVLSDKLVVYDLESQIIGWTDYNCSSSITIQDEETSKEYNVYAKDISSVGNLEVNFVKGMWLLATIIFFNFIH